MMKSPGLLVAAVASALLPAAVEAVQDTTGPAAGIGQASPASMVWGFEERCAVCHDDPNPENRAPTREALREMTPERVLTSMTTGLMAAMAAGWGDDQLRAMAELVAGKPFGGSVDHRRAEAMSNQCSAGLSLDNSDGPAWNGWSPDPTKSYRFQPVEAGGLTGLQVGDLELKWAFAIPDATSASWAQPTVFSGTLFIGSDNNFVYALDARTGCVHWSHEARGQVRTAITIGEVTQAPDARYAAYYGDYMGYVTAVDAETGEELWTARPDDHPGAKITGSIVRDPSPEGLLFVPVSSWEEGPGGTSTYRCCTFQGSVVALDPNTGQEVWKTYTHIERPQSLGTNASGTQLYGPAGASVWQTPTLDLVSRVVYAPTSNCYITEFFESRDFDQGVCESVMAFDMDSGERLWWTSLDALDRFRGGCGLGPEQRVNCPGLVLGPNSDASGSPVLHTLSNGSRVLIQGQESGRITAVDPDNDGEVLWVSQAGDEIAASNAGFGGAFDGTYYLKPMPFSDGSGGIAAIRATDGSRAWFTTVPKPRGCPDVLGEQPREYCHSGNWAAASAIPGAVFVGSADGTMRTYASEDGEVLWEYQTNRSFPTVNGVAGYGGGFGGAGATVADGMVYVGSGYAILRGQPGNVLLAFGLR